MVILDLRALVEACTHMQDGVIAVVQPHAGEHEVGAIAFFEVEHVAVEFFDGREVCLRAADVEVQKALEEFRGGASCGYGRCGGVGHDVLLAVEVERAFCAVRARRSSRVII